MGRRLAVAGGVAALAFGAMVAAGRAYEAAAAEGWPWVVAVTGGLALGATLVIRWCR